MNRLCILALLALIGWRVPFAQAQPQELAFEHVPLPGGYVSNFVNGMVQDPQGFLWLATRAWLIKYDGYGTTTYRPNPHDPGSIASSKWVETVYVDREGTLWVGTFGGGLDRFNPENESFSHFPHDSVNPASLSGDTVTVMLEDRSGTFWVGTHQGLNRMDRKTGTFTRFRHDPDDPRSLSNDQVRSLYEDRQGTLWIGTGSPWGGESPPEGGGLNRFDPKTETFTRYLHDPADESSLIDNHVSALLEDARGTFWVGTAGDGLHSMDRSRGTFKRHLRDPSDPNRLSMPHVDEISGPAYVTVLHEDQSGRLWIGAINGGLSRYDPVADRLVHFKNVPGGPGHLGSTLVHGFSESREGTRWVATWDGLFKIVQKRRTVQHYLLEAPDGGAADAVKAFLEDDASTLWIGTEAGGLSRLNWTVDDGRAEGWMEPDVRYRHDPDDPHSLSSNKVLSLEQDREGRLWIGTGRGLDRMDRRSGRFTRFQHDPEDPGTLGAGQVFSVCEDRQGEIWVGVYGGGLNRLDRRTGRFERYLHDASNPNSLSDNDVVVVHEDREGILWIGTLRGGLNRFDPQSETFTRYPHPVADSSGLSDGFVTSIYEDRSGMLWIGTMLGGLNRFDRSTGRFSHFTSANSGLPDNRIQRILGDGDGNLWISTGNGAGSGLVRFAPEEGTFYAFDTGLDLPTGTALPGAYEHRNGHMFFGGENGFVVFPPDEVVRNAVPNVHPPQVVLTGLKLFNEALADGMEDPSMGQLLESGEVKLPHDENTFAIDFVGLHFDNPAENRYSYKLEGYDDRWRAVGTERQAAYYKVPPGDYVFRVKAASSDGVWNEEGASIQVSILPPWWSTTWAYGFYGLLLLGGVVAVDRVQRRRVVRKEREAVHERELEQKREIEGAYEQLKSTQQKLILQSRKLAEMDELKSRFFTNISHEFRTPLTLLIGPIRDLVEGRIDAHQLASHVPVMHRSARRLLRLINQLLDLSRLEAGGMQLHERRRDLVASLRRHVLSFTSHAEREGVTLVFTAEPDVIETAFDADKLEKVVSNLLSNAFKFTPSGGRIRVTVGRVGTFAEITVRDTGEGMAAEELLHVFDRFYQVDRSSTRRHDGTGIGLSLAQELVELHGGTITVESERGFGSNFTVRLPLHGSTKSGERAMGTPDQPEVLPGDSRGDEYGDRMPLGEGNQRAVEHPQQEVHAPSTAPTILIVEDNADMRSYLRSHLEGGYRLLEARDGAEGLRQARKHQPDLVISDVMMPEMDGFALCEAIKSDEEIGHIPVVLLTAKADEASRIEGLQTGADAFLSKPFSAEELTTRVENLVEIRRRLRERFSDSVRLGPADIVVNSEDATFIEGARDVIEAQMGDSRFGVSRMADELGLSERQLHRRVKETAGLTPGGYIRMMRLERASQLLAQQGGRISDVAYAVGFKNAKYFSRLFRQTFGRAPSDDVGADPQ